LRLPALDSVQTDTAPFELGDGPDACLLIHGFTGSPWELRPLGESLAAAGIRAKAIRLPGHALSPEALLGVTEEDWREAVEREFVAMPGKRKFVAGLSMGALLAIDLAAKHPELAGMALLAPAIALQGAKARIARAMRALPVMEMLQPWQEKDGVDVRDPESKRIAPYLPRFPSTRVRDVWALQDLARAQASRVRAPTLVAIGEHDTVIDNRAAKGLVRTLHKNARTQFLELKGSAHQLGRDIGREVLAQEMIRFFHSA
jgi:carboxylesterase